MHARGGHSKGKLKSFTALLQVVAMRIVYVNNVAKTSTRGVFSRAWHASETESKLLQMVLMSCILSLV